MAGKNVFIVMPYYNRLHQLQRTLASIARTNYGRYHIVIVDDASHEGLIKQNNDIDERLSILRFNKKHWISPDVAANTGIHYALKRGADIIILQNPECYHCGDIISYTVQNLSDENYISFSCFSLNKEASAMIDNAKQHINQRCASFDFETAWYNHPLYRPVGYEFCAAISAGNMKRLNGYDERFAQGWAYSDNYLLHRIRKAGLRVEIPDETNPFVFHQWHPRQEYRLELIKKNQKLFEYLVQKDTIKALHIFTKNFDE